MVSVHVMGRTPVPVSCHIRGDVSVASLCCVRSSIAQAIACHHTVPHACQHACWVAPLAIVAIVHFPTPIPVVPFACFLSHRAVVVQIAFFTLLCNLQCAGHTFPPGNPVPRQGTGLQPEVRGGATGARSETKCWVPLSRVQPCPGRATRGKRVSPKKRLHNQASVIFEVGPLQYNGRGPTLPT